MQKIRKKPLDVVRRVDFRARGKFASNVVTSPIPSHSSPGADGAGRASVSAGLPKQPSMRLFAHGRLLVALMGLGCQPTASIAQPGATRFEIPVPHESAPTTTGASPQGPGAKGPGTNTATPAPGLPRELPRAFARQQTCAQGSCSLLRWLPEASYALSPLEEVSAQAAIWVHDIQSGAKLSVPANDALEFVVVGLRGELRVHDTRSGASPESEYRVQPWTAHTFGCGTRVAMCGLPVRA